MWKFRGTRAVHWDKTQSLAIAQDIPRAQKGKLRQPTSWQPQQGGVIEWGLFSGMEMPGEKPGRLRSCGHGLKLSLSESQPRPRLEQGWQGQLGKGMHPAGLREGQLGFLPPFLMLGLVTFVTVVTSGVVQVTKS